MPAYHSTLNSATGFQNICGATLLPIRSKVRGTAPAAADGTKDIIDEAIEFFRANVLFRSFQPEGGADLILCYLTIYIGELLRHLAKSSKTATDAKKNVIQVSMNQSFAVPGDTGFCLSGFFKAGSRTDQDTIRGYLNHVRQELANRLIDVIYNADGTQNKWWFSFQRRKFMNIEKT